MYRILTLLLFLCSAPAVVAQAPPKMAEQPLAIEESTQNTSIQFSFEKADWKDVIPWFAEQTGYSWQKLGEWPEGTFTLTDNEKYSPMGALDQINYALRLRKPPYTIIRNRNQLILTEASSPLEAELIETVTPAELDQRGAYEIVSCRFSLGSINVADVEGDLRSSISQQYQQFIKVSMATNEFYARETGATLRGVRNLIVEMTKRKATSFDTYALKNYDPEQFLIITRPLLNIADGGYQSGDGALVISVDPANNRFILKGTPTAIEEFKNIAATVDVPANAIAVNTEAPYFKSYAVFTDPEMALKVVETFLDGTDATVGQDGITGTILLHGRKEHHQKAAETIAELRGEQGTTKIVQLKNSSASTILSAVQQIMGLSTTSLEAPKGPKLLANTVKNYIMIRGTPAEIYEVEQTILQLDKAEELDPNRPRNNIRVLKMPPGKRDELMGSASDYMRSTGRKNQMRFVMPEDRNKSNRSVRQFGSPGSNSKELQQSDMQKMRVPPAAPSVRGPAPAAKPNAGARARRNTSRRSAFAASGLLNFGLTSLVAYQPQDEAGSYSESSQNLNTNNVPPETYPSVPGAPIVVKGTDFGILLESEDLDALDELELLLLSQVGETGTEQGPTIFYLKYKKSATIKSALDTMFGLGGSDGGGGGGDLLSGIVGNVAGEGAGDLLGGMLGGGGASSSGATITLEGDVQIGMYAPQNLLYVGGATQSDLDTIEEMIDIFDQPSPPQDPELVGQFFSIEIQHRDPQAILQTIQNLLADYIVSSEKPQQNEGGGNTPDQIARTMRNIAGGGKGGRRGGNAGGEAEQEQPKARLDLQDGKILITGPEFIFNQIKAIVERIDTPKPNKPKQSRSLLGVTEQALKLLQEQFGENIVIADEDDGEGAKDAPSGGNNNRSSGNQSNNRAGQDAANNARRQRQQQGIDQLRNIEQRRGGGGGGRRGATR